MSELLQFPPLLDAAAQDRLLAKVEPVFTAEDNALLIKVPTKKEVEETLNEANLHAAPGSDGLTSFLYKEFWDTLGDSLTEVTQAVHRGEQPTCTQRTSLMVFGTKPKKSKSLKPSDKRKISLLNADFKLLLELMLKGLRKLPLTPFHLASWQLVTIVASTMVLTRQEMPSRLQVEVKKVWDCLTTTTRQLSTSWSCSGCSRCCWLKGWTLQSLIG